MQTNVQDKTKRLYNWGIFTIIVVIIILVCVSLPFLISNQSAKTLLFGLIGALIFVIILFIGLMEWFKRRSNRKKLFPVPEQMTQTSETTESLYTPTVSLDVGYSVSARSSWTHWNPRKKSPPVNASAPLETEIF